MSTSVVTVTSILTLRERRQSVTARRVQSTIALRAVVLCKAVSKTCDL